MDYRKKKDQLLSELKRVTGLELSLSDSSLADDTIEKTVESLSALCEACRMNGSRETVLRRWMTGECSESEFLEGAVRLHIDPARARILFYFEMEESIDDSLISVLRQILADRSGSIIIPLNDHALVILDKPLRAASSAGRNRTPETAAGGGKSRTPETAAGGQALSFRQVITDSKIRQDAYDMAESILSLLSTELFINAKAATSFELQNLLMLPIAFSHALYAIKAGKIFQPDRQVYSYEDMGEGRLLYDLGGDICADYIAETLGSDFDSERSHIFDGDILLTVECFLQNNMNIAETARQLHVHRNTLLYRLDQIQKETGLDVRRFKDAMRYYLCSLIISKEKLSR